MSASGIGSKSSTKLYTTYNVEEGRTEDRKVAATGDRNVFTGEGSNVSTVQSNSTTQSVGAINGFSGKDVGDLLAGITHDSPFGQPASASAKPVSTATAGASVPWMPTPGALRPIQRVPSGFDGPGGTGVRPCAQES